MGPVVDRSLPDLDAARSGVGDQAHQNPSKQPGRRRLLLRRARPSSPAPSAPVGKRKRRRNPGIAVVRLLMKLWIPLVILAVLGAGALTVSRLHGVFGSDDSISYGDTRSETAEPVDPKIMRYEIFGPAGTVAEISYFDENGDPEFIEQEPLPWSLEFPITTAASIGSIAAQGDSDSIGCRILIDGVLKDEQIATHEASTFTSCMLKAA